MIPYLTAKVMVEGISLTYEREKYLFGVGVSTIYLNNMKECLCTGGCGLICEWKMWQL